MIDHGARWELDIIAECDALKMARRAVATKRSNPLKILRPYRGPGSRPGMMISVITLQEALDFEGALQRPRGLAVAFDAKTTCNPDRFDLKMICDAQLDYASWRASFGALVGIYLQRRCSETQRQLARYWLDLDDCARVAGLEHSRSANAVKRASIRWDELEGFKLSGDEPTWLDGARRLSLALNLDRLQR